MPTMSENKKAGKADTFLSWTLGVLACLWVAWCCGIGPLYWFGTGLADFGWANVLYMAIASLFRLLYCGLWSVTAVASACCDVFLASVRQAVPGGVRHADDGIGHHAASSERRRA